MVFSIKSKLLAVFYKNTSHQLISLDFFASLVILIIMTQIQIMRLFSKIFFIEKHCKIRSKSEHPNKSIHAKKFSHSYYINSKKSDPTLSTTFKSKLKNILKKKYSH